MAECVSYILFWWGLFGLWYIIDNHI